MEQKRGGINIEKALQTELMTALNEMFYAILCVKPEEDTVLILQSSEHPCSAQQKLSWTEYLGRYSVILTEESYRKVKERFSSEALLASSRKGERNFTLDASYLKEGKTNWLTASALVKEQPDGRPYVYIFIRQTNEEHLLRSIIELYVFNICDYFIYLDARNNSYVMFSGSTSGTPLPPEICNDYEAATIEYAHSFVVQEDQEMVIREMQLERVLDQLDRHGVHTFYCGVIDPVRGYTRKQLSYQYYDRDAQMILLSRTDVTGIYLEERARKKELKAAKLRAETDTLTGLLNYGGVSRHVSASLAESAEAALLFIDLDNFKQVNDCLGHQEGDQILRKIAQVLQLQTGERGIQGRIGGDEFVVFLRDITAKEQAEGYAKRICEAVGRLTLPENGAPTISCSIGIAMAPEDGKDYKTLIKHADRRAYQAKARGKNRFSF